MIGLISEQEIASLPPMPVALVRLTQMANDFASNIEEISRTIELDIGLTTGVLRLANSAWCAPRAPILTVRQAIIRLGLARIAWMAMGRHVNKTMAGELPGYELSANELWQHSVASALAAEQIAQSSAEPVPAVAFTAALLHDVGKLLLGRHLDPSKVMQLRQMVGRDGITYVQAEHELLGTDHAQVGGAIALAWKLPDALVRAIARHHDELAEGDALLDVVHVSNLVAKLVGVGLGSEQMNVFANSTAARRLGLSAAQVETVCSRVSHEMELWNKSYGSVSHESECAVGG